MPQHPFPQIDQAPAFRQAQPALAWSHAQGSMTDPLT
jgi:hypothetical protein